MYTCASLHIVSIYLFLIVLTGSVGDAASYMATVKLYLVTVVHPALCVMGLVGNMLNMLVLTRRRIKVAMNSDIEKASHLGLVALAVSDTLYCLTALPDAFLSSQETVYTSKSFILFVTMYGKSIQNIFMRASTWLTVIMATGRYIAICRPLQARYIVEVRATLTAVILSFVVWAILQLPSFWTFHLEEFSCPSGTIYILDSGYFVLNKTLLTTCSYVWSVLGYVIPVTLLAYCNFHLIQALRQSYRMRKLYRVHTRRSTDSSQITPTLVAIVCMFIVLVSPSEIVTFYFYSVTGSQLEVHNFIITVTNTLHTMNFAFNFVLYCLVNRHFRKTWNSLLCLKQHNTHYNPMHRCIKLSDSDNPTVSTSVKASPGGHRLIRADV